MPNKRDDQTMHDANETKTVSLEIIERNIYIIRGQKVMLDSDLAKLYDVATRRLNEQVKRNLQRFPEDFVFQLTTDELTNLRSQIATSSLKSYGGRRYLPYVFTEQGVAMLSSVLNSEQAIQVNIAIMRTFVNMRRTLSTNEEVNRKFEEIEEKLGEHDEQFKKVFAAIRLLINPPQNSKKKIGFLQKDKDNS